MTPAPVPRDAEQPGSASCPPHRVEYQGFHSNVGGCRVPAGVADGRAAA